MEERMTEQELKTVFHLEQMKFTYSQKEEAVYGDRRFESQDLSVRFPQEMKVQLNGTTFTAMVENPWDAEHPNISVKLGRESQRPTFDLEIRSPELLMETMWLAALRGMGGMMWIAQKSRSSVIHTEQMDYLCLYDVNKEFTVYHVYLTKGRLIQPLVFTIRGTENCGEEVGLDLVRSFMQKVQVKQLPFEPLTEVADAQFIQSELTEALLDHWESLWVSHAKQLENRFFIAIQMVQLEMKQKHKLGTFSQADARQTYKAKLQEYAQRMEELLSQLEVILPDTYASNQANPVFYEMVDRVLAFVDEHKLAQIRVDHNDIAVPVKNAPKVWAKWRYCTLLKNQAETKSVLEPLTQKQEEYTRIEAQLKAEHDQLMDKLKVLEQEINEGKAEHNEWKKQQLQELDDMAEAKNAERQQLWEQGEELKKQIQETSFFRRSLKEKLNAELSECIRRVENIRSELSLLEKKRREVQNLQAEAVLDKVEQVNYYRRMLFQNMDDAKGIDRCLSANQKETEEQRTVLDEIESEMEQLRNYLKYH